MLHWIIYIYNYIIIIMYMMMRFKYTQGKENGPVGTQSLSREKHWLAGSPLLQSFSIGPLGITLS
jgi:cytochrome b561